MSSIDLLLIVMSVMSGIAVIASITLYAWVVARTRPESGGIEDFRDLPTVEREESPSKAFAGVGASRPVHSWEYEETYLRDDNIDELRDQLSAAP